MIKLLKRKSHGFTLIELMIVIAIIAILAAILVPNFIRARAQSQLSACGGNLKNIATALELYATDSNGSYAPSSPSLVGTYMRTMPACPTGSAYAYVVAVTPTAGFTLSHVTANSHTSVGSTGVSPIYTGANGLQTQ